MLNFTQKAVQKEFLLIAVSVVFALGLVVVVYIFNIPDSDALNTCSTGYQITGSSKQISCHGICRVVSSSSTAFVGTNTSQEWGSFLGNAPGGTSIGSCPSGGGGGTTDGLRCRCVFSTGATGAWSCQSSPSPPPCTGFAESVECYCSTLCNNSGC